VYLATSLLTGKKVAIKIFDQNAEAVNRFAQELRVLSKVNHPNIRHLIGFGRTIGTDSCFLVLEHIDGRDFVSASRTMSQHHFHSMIVEILRALDYLHRKGLTHGDLKPQNILVASSSPSKPGQPIVKLIDLGFGIDGSYSGQDLLKGTPLYLAPEIIRGQRPTIRSDLYSLGAILYECLVGAPPFDGSDIGQIIQGHLNTPPRAIEEDALRELHPLILQLLSKEPERRPVSPGHASRILNSLSRIEPVRLETAESCRAYATTLPLMGREQILSDFTRLLTTACRTVSQSRTHFVLIPGPEGFGKSRLLRELTVLAQIFDLGVIAHPGHQPQSRPDPFENVLHNMFGDSSTLPLLIAIDDAFGNDGQSLIPLEALLSNVDNPRVVALTLNTSSVDLDVLSEIKATLSTHGELHVWPVAPLGHSEVKAAVEGGLGGRLSDDAAVRNLYEMSGGIPFILMELLADYLDKGYISVDRDVLTITSPSNSSSTPPVITKRLEALMKHEDSSQLEIVCSLSIVGEPIDVQQLGIILKRDPASLLSSCRHLEHRGIIKSTSHAGSSRFTVGSGFLRTHSSSRISSERKTRLHDTVASWYLSRPQDPDARAHAAVHTIAAGRREENTIA
jgi:serine/threonine protein kinase